MKNKIKHFKEEFEELVAKLDEAKDIIDDEIGFELVDFDVEGMYQEIEFIINDLYSKGIK
jgi:hypothetical protein